MSGVGRGGGKVEFSCKHASFEGGFEGGEGVFGVVEQKILEGCFFGEEEGHERLKGRGSVRQGLGLLSRLEDDFFVGLCLSCVADGVCEVGHDEGSGEGLCGMGEDGFEEFPFAQVEVEVVGFSEGDGRHVRGGLSGSFGGELWRRAFVEELGGELLAESFCRGAWGGRDGAGRSRTDGLLRAKQALCQLSYSPESGDWEKYSIGGEGARGKNGIFGAETWIFTRFDAKCPFVHENT